MSPGDSDSDSDSDPGDSASDEDILPVNLDSNLDDLGFFTADLETTLDFPEQIEVVSDSTSNSSTISSNTSNSDEPENSLEEDHPLLPKSLHNL